MVLEAATPDGAASKEVTEAMCPVTLMGMEYFVEPAETVKVPLPLFPEAVSRPRLSTVPIPSETLQRKQVFCAVSGRLW